MLQEQQPGSQGAQERRTMRRFYMRLPATVRMPLGGDGYEIATETQNVSARGIFFYLDQPVVEGARIEVTMTFPPNITLTDAVRVRFIARVVRIEQPLPVSRVGVAAVIEEYEFLRPTPNSDFPLDSENKSNLQ
jgi:PilZ domain